MVMKHLYERPHPRYADDSPEAGPWMTCDDCGFQWSQKDMGFQLDFYGGADLKETGMIKCPRCMDAPAYQQRLLLVPEDPRIIPNLRPEMYAVDSTNFLATQDSNIISTEDGDAIVVDIPNPPLPSDEGGV